MEKAKNKLSVIVPVYNSVDWLEQCVDSILAQSYENFELFLVDDASTDGSGEICDEYVQNDARVHVIHHAENKGLSVSREDGFRASDGDWVSFIDNDDIIAPDMYERCMNFANEQEIEIVCGRCEEKTSKEMATPIWTIGDKRLTIMPGKESCDKIFAGRFDFPSVKSIWGKLIRRNVIEKTLLDVLQYRERLNWVYFEDVLITPIMLCHADKIVFYNCLMYMHRRTQESLSSTLQPRAFHYQAVEASFEALDFLEQQSFSEAYKEHMIGCFLNMQSVWYKVWKNETDMKKKENFNNYVDEMVNRYASKLRTLRCKNFSDAIKKLNFILFRLSKNFWGRIVGNLYFGVIRKDCIR